MSAHWFHPCSLGFGCVRLKTYTNHYWLVVWTPLKNISQLGWLFPIYGINKKCSKPPTSRDRQVQVALFAPCWLQQSPVHERSARPSSYPWNPRWNSTCCSPWFHCFLKAPESLEAGRIWNSCPCVQSKPSWFRPIQTSGNFLRSSKIKVHCPILDHFKVKHPHAMVVDTVLGNGFCFTLAGLGLCAGLEGAEADGLEWSSSTASLRSELGSASWSTHRSGSFEKRGWL